MLTVKNEEIENIDIEDILKTKMNELSDSVDCFDRISARAFPKEKNDFSEDGYIISDLENITGRSRKPNIIKWTAVAAAAVVCIAVLPKTGFVRNVFYHLGSGSVKKSYQKLITEINTELEAGGYTIVDIPLEQYIKNDVLITPLFSCPFEDCGKDDANVRLFIKQIDGINTTQMYAALYCGTYTENNIIAAAESDFKFTSKDMTTQFEQGCDCRQYSAAAVEVLFEGNDDGQLIDKDGNIVSLASCAQSTVIKDENGVHKVTSEVLYGHKNEPGYFYDIITYKEESDNSLSQSVPTNSMFNDTIELPDRNNMWRKSIYFNGNSAFPEESISDFIQTDLYENVTSASTSQTDIAFVYPNSIYDDKDKTFTERELFLRGKETGKNIASIKEPNDFLTRATLMIYYSPSIFNIRSASVQETGVVIKDSSNNLICSNDFPLQTSETELSENEEIERKQLEEYNRNLIEENREFYEQLAEEQQQLEEQEQLRLEAEQEQRIYQERQTIENMTPKK